MIRCQGCETWTLPTPGDAWCPVHGVIPIPEHVAWP